MLRASAVVRTGNLENTVFNGTQHLPFEISAWKEAPIHLHHGLQYTGPFVGRPVSESMLVQSVCCKPACLNVAKTSARQW